MSSLCTAYIRLKSVASFWLILAELENILCPTHFANVFKSMHGLKVIQFARTQYFKHLNCNRDNGFAIDFNITSFHSSGIRRLRSVANKVTSVCLTCWTNTFIFYDLFCFVLIKVRPPKSTTHCFTFDYVGRDLCHWHL